MVDEWHSETSSIIEKTRSKHFITLFIRQTDRLLSWPCFHELCEVSNNNYNDNNVKGELPYEDYTQVLFCDRSCRFLSSCEIEGTIVSSTTGFTQKEFVSLRDGENTKQKEWTDEINVEDSFLVSRFGVLPVTVLLLILDRLTNVTNNKSKNSCLLISGFS